MNNKFLVTRYYGCSKKAMTVGCGEYDFSTWLVGMFGGETNYGRRIFILLFFVEKKGAKKATRKTRLTGRAGIYSPPKKIGTCFFGSSYGQQ